MEGQFDLEITKFVLSKMAEHMEAGSVITRLLKMVGEHFGLHHIAIVEKNKNMPSFAITYEFCAPECPGKLNHIVYFGEDEWQQGMKLFENTDMLYYESAAAGDSNFMQSINKEVQGAFCAALLEQRAGSEAAMLFQYNRAGHVFSEEEKTCFAMVKQLVNLYLMPMRDYEQDREELHRVKLFDSLTGLMKYENFINVAEQIYHNDTTGAVYAVVYSDINNFKYINEYYGHQAGDDVLRRFEQFFMSDSPIQMIASRLFSDYFISLVKLNGFTTEQMLVAMLEKLNRKFSDGVGVSYPEAKASIVSGIAIVGDKKINIMTYIDRANIARKMAKRSFGRSCLIYDESMEAQKKKELEITSQAEMALFLGEFYFELQPKIDLDTKKVIGAEALVRWKKNDGGRWLPDEFIPVFEKSGFITRLDFMVYTEVCRYLRERMKKKLEIVPISVNVSRLHFEQEDFVEQVISLVDSYGVPHNYLEFEITESVFIEQMTKANIAIRKLREAGFLVSMDDFGSGYSSLNLLKELDFDVLKLDKEFLAHGTVDRKEAVIISNIIQMAKQMNITVLCEGVETIEQADFLAKADCDLVQGYYYGKPMLIENFNELLTDDH